VRSAQEWYPPVVRHRQDKFSERCGHPPDAETGLAYYRARYYDQSTGRFWSEDPIGFDGGVNFYLYGDNNPVLLIDPFGLSSLVFDRKSGTLTLLDKDGKVVIVCDAANNAERKSNGPWKNGTYPFLRHKDHPADPNGSFGSYGIYIFDVPGRSDMGVHSGQANVPDQLGRKGPQHATDGCVRTTDTCMQKITNFQANDPLTKITIR
jgi:RHS repeat-associated protein